MQTINTDKFNDLISSGQTLIADPSDEVMVFLTTDGDIIKKFHYKDKFISRIFPRVLRFKNNCNKLTALGFKTMTVKEIFDFPESSSHVAIYPLISGITLEEYLDGDAKEPQKRDMLMRAAAYYGKLHQKGVYCRPTHFRNIIICPNDDFALIDVQNIRLRTFSLDLWTRSRNFKYIFKYKKNINQLINFGAMDFFNSYMKESQMGKLTQRIFLSLLQHNAPNLFNDGKFRS